MTAAVLLVSHGTVDDLDDLPAFVAGIRRGHAPPPELVAELRRRYEAIGGKSPLGDINAALARKLAAKLGVRVALANRLWTPYVRDVLAALAADGVTRVALVPLAQHSAHVYAEDARRAVESLRGVALACASSWGGGVKLCEAYAKRIVDVLASVADPRRTMVVMTAHSLPRAVVEAGDPYERDVRAAAEAIAGVVRARAGADVRWTLAYQSQGLSTGPGGRPVAWLGPDLSSTIAEAAARGDTALVFAPIGFLADHVEVLYDLDIEAARLSEERGLSFRRTESLNASDDLVEVLADVARPLLAEGA